MPSVIRRLLLQSPTAKAVVPALLAAAIGVLSGSLITEITTSSGLAWSGVLRTFSFYALLALAILQALYGRLLYQEESDVLRFSDEQYCIAYLRSKCLPEMASRYQEMIRSGQGGEFKQAMDEVREVLK